MDESDSSSQNLHNKSNDGFTDDATKKLNFSDDDCNDDQRENSEGIFQVFYI